MSELDKAQALMLPGFKPGKGNPGKTRAAGAQGRGTLPPPAPAPAPTPKHNIPEGFTFYPQEYADDGTPLPLRTLKPLPLPRTTPAYEARLEQIERTYARLRKKPREELTEYELRLLEGARCEQCGTRGFDNTTVRVKKYAADGKLESCRLVEVCRRCASRR